MRSNRLRVRDRLASVTDLDEVRGSRKPVSIQEASEARLHMWARLTFWYHISPERLVFWPNNIVQAYYEELDSLVAEYQMIHSQASGLPYMEEKDRKALVGDINKRIHGANFKDPLEDLAAHADGPLNKPVGQITLEDQGYTRDEEGNAVPIEEYKERQAREAAAKEEARRTENERRLAAHHAEDDDDRKDIKPPSDADEFEQRSANMGFKVQWVD